MAFQSDLSKARGLGSAKSGVMHWWHQRVSAVFIIPLVIWFIYSSIGLIGKSPEYLKGWFSSPYHAVLSALMFGAMFYHAALGLQVVIEDYIHCKCSKYFLLIASKFIALMFGATVIISILKLHLGN